MISMNSKYGQINAGIGIFVVYSVGDCGSKVLGLVGQNLELDGVGAHGVAA